MSMIDRIRYYAYLVGIYNMLQLGLQVGLCLKEIICIVILNNRY